MHLPTGLHGSCVVQNLKPLSRDCSEWEAPGVRVAIYSCRTEKGLPMFTQQAQISFSMVVSTSSPVQGARDGFLAPCPPCPPCKVPSLPALGNPVGNFFWALEQLSSDLRTFP